MRVALSLSKLYGNIDLAGKPIDELVERIGSQLGAVEEVVSLREQYAGVLIARVISCVDHPDSDHLHLCKVDDGGVAQNVERDEHGYVQVVCGAPNVREGILAAWLPPGSTVPSTYHKEPLVLEARKIRGTLSNGMLASAKELGISDDHVGILEVDEDVAPGTAFAEAYHLNDHIIDIENKMFTHRPDCFGVLGVYREIAGIYHQQFVSPEWYAGETPPLTVEANVMPLDVANELPELAPRFVMVPMSDIDVKPSPVSLQVHLMRAGIRPINNVVDITNYLMYLTGQPLHAYDYDKVRALTDGDTASVTVRYPREGEKIALLNGKEITPRKEAIMIASGDHLIGLGGVMGGSETEVDEATKNIILECATFDMYSIRRTSMAHGLFTDAVTRFNKGQSPLQNVRVIARAVQEIRELAHGKVAGDVADVNHVQEAARRGSLHPPVNVEREFINARLGLHLAADEMKRLLTNVEFQVDASGEALTVTEPFWRTDIEMPEDVVEEVGRLYGYDHLPLELPRRDITPAPRNNALELKHRARGALARAGANEVLTYTFVHGDLIDKAGQDRDMAFQLSNALSPELQYYRLSLTPSLLNLVHANIKAGYDEFALFELNPVHGKSDIDDDGLPKELARVALVYAADPKAAAESYVGAPYYQARYYLETLMSEFALAGKLTYKPLDEADIFGYELFEQMSKPFEPKRSALVYNGELLVGIVGEYRRAAGAALKLPECAAGFEIFGSALAKGGMKSYAQLSRFPKVEQDISLKVPADVSYGELYELVCAKLRAIAPERTCLDVKPVDLYQRPDDAAHKQVTLRVTMSNFDRTLKAEEVNSLLDAAAAQAGERFGAERI